MKRRILIAVLSLCMVVTMLPLSIYAAEDGIDDINTDGINTLSLEGEGTKESPYLSADESTLAEAVAAGGYIKLTASFAGQGLTVNKDVTLDLNGQTLTFNHVGSENIETGFTVDADGSLTITDSAEGAVGKVTAEEKCFDDKQHAFYVVKVNANGEFILEDGKLENTWYDLAASPVIYNSGTLTLNGGEVSGTTCIYNWAVENAVTTVNVEKDAVVEGVPCTTDSLYNNRYLGASYGLTWMGLGVGESGRVNKTETPINDAMIININGGKISGTQGLGTNASNGSYAGFTLNITDGLIDGGADGTGAYIPALGVINISGGTITGAQGIRIAAGELNITGGEIIGTKCSDGEDLIAGGSGGTLGAVVIGKASSGYVGDVKVTVSGETVVKNTSDESDTPRPAIVVSDKNMANADYGYQDASISVVVDGGEIAGDIVKISNLKKGTTTQDGGNTNLTVKNTTVSGDVINQSKTGLTVENGTVTGDITNSSSGSVLANDTAIEGNLTNSSDGSIVVLGSSKVNGEVKNDGMESGGSLYIENDENNADKDDTVAVSINSGKLYDSLEEAINEAVSGDTITLLDNVELEATQNITKDLTLNLNGHTVTGNDVRAFQVKEGTLSLTGEGTVTSVRAENDSQLAESSSVIRVGDNDGDGGRDAALIIGEDVTISAPATYGVSVFGSKTTETVTVFGTIEAVPAAAIAGNGSAGYEGTTIIIKDGAVLESGSDEINENPAIYHPQAGELIIEGGTISGASGIEMKAGTLTITGSPTITATAEVDHNKNGNGPSTKGYAVVAVENDAYAGAVKVQLDGGNYEGKVAIVSDNDEGTDPGEKAGDIEISGGKFSDTEGLNEYLAPGKKLSSNGTVVKKSSGSSSSSAASYSVTAPSKVENGSISVSPKNADKDKTVTITAKADEGYELSKLIVKDKNGNEIKLTNAGNDKYTFTMPAGNVTIEADFSEAVKQLPFKDVSKTDWYYEAAKYVYDEGMMSGTADDLFSPNISTTRGMIVTILYRLEKEPTVSNSSFSDVSENAYYAKAVAWAATENIVGGYGDGKFGPEDPITREQLAAILYRYAQYKGTNNSNTADLSVFTDAASISEYAEDAMRFAVGNGIMNGNGDGTINPTGTATRAEAAQMLMNFLK